MFVASYKSANDPLLGPLITLLSPLWSFAQRSRFICDLRTGNIQLTLITFFELTEVVFVNHTGAVNQ